MDTETQPDTLRMVLLGTTGSGKSSTGNTICGGRVFTTNSTDGHPSFKCTLETADINGQRLSIVDTPGLLDLNKSNVEVEREIAKGVALAAPGPHVLLVVIRSDKYTNDEQKAVKIIQRMFGKEGSCYTMVLFTHGDDLEANAISIHEIVNQTPDLRGLFQQCDGGYHVFNNRDKDPSQVRELLEKINTMVEENGGGYYTNDLRLDMGYKDRLATAIAIGSAIGGVIAAVATGAAVTTVGNAVAAVGVSAGAATGAAMAAVGAGAGAIAGAAAGATTATFVVALTTATMAIKGVKPAAAAAVAAAGGSAAAGVIGGAAFLAASAMGRIVGAGVAVTVSAAAGAGAIAGACAGYTFLYIPVGLPLPALLVDASYDVKIGVDTVILGGAVCCGAAAGAAVGAYIDEDDAGADAVDRRVAVAVAAVGGVAGAAAGGLGVANVAGSAALEAIAKRTIVPVVAARAGDLVALGVAVRAVRASSAILFESCFAKEAIISVASVAMIWWLKRN